MKNTIHPNRLFVASCIALIATAMTFAIRANLIGSLGKEFGISPGEMGIVFGTAFWGFTLSMIIGGFLCDLLGMKHLLILAFASHLAGIILTILATDFWSLFISTLFIGIANGMVEAACNPLIASMYPEEKTKRLNLFHVWFPGGIVIGGLTAYAFNNTLGESQWQWQVAAILIPTILYGVLFLNQKFPVTERVTTGVSTIEMMKECTRPLFLFMVFCMLITAATELGTNQWIAALLENVGISSILLLVFINGLMALGRSFAGKIEHALSPSGMLLFSAFFSSLGLFLLGNVSGYWSFAAAALFALGICFFWPTMLGYVSEYMPKTGAMGLAIMGGAGMLSVSLILPFIGDLYEAQIQLNLPSEISLASLAETTPDSEEAKLLSEAKLAGGAATLKYVALLPAFLVVAFGFLYFWRKKLTNYKKAIA